MNTSNTAIIYGRVSTKEQENSVNLQDAKMLDYARFKGLAIPPDAMFFDEDVSGSVPISERPAGRKMLDYLTEGKAEHLIVAKLDRLGRNAVDLQNAYRALTCDMGIVIHIIDLGGDSFSSDNPFSKFIIGLLSLIAELERETIRGRIIDVLDHKFAIGECIGSPPFGFTTRDTDRLNKRGLKIKLMIDHPDEMPWLRKILHWRYVGESETLLTPQHTHSHTPPPPGPWSLRRIAQELNARRVPTKKRGTISTRTRQTVTKPWDKTRVLQLLNSKHVRRLKEQLYPEPSAEAVNE